MSDVELGTSFKAIEAGALMVLGKPHGLPGQDPEADRLIAHVKAMADVKVVRRRWGLQKSAQAKALSTTDPTTVLRSVQMIAIGASTGGPPALHVILSQLPADLPLPVLVVQHISSGFVGGLARWLDETTPLRVKVAEMGERLQPGTVYLAPDGQHLLLKQRGLVGLGNSPPVDGHRPSVTALFESVARHYGSAAVGILLTGMGGDGARGLKMLLDAGGQTIAQDEHSSVVFGMPKVAIALDAADEVLPLDRIGPRLLRLVPQRAGIQLGTEESL